MGISSYIDQFEKEGATLARPVLPEANFKAVIQEITCRFNKGTVKKGANKGKEVVIFNWGIKLALLSETAQQHMKQDNDVIVYADGGNGTSGTGTINLGNGLLNLKEEVGITFDGNGTFWNFIGSIFEQVELAEKKQDDSGMKTYVLPRHILESIYSGTEELEEQLKNDPDTEEIEIPAKLAEHQIKNISELITGEADTSNCYVHMSRRSSYNDKTVKQHFVKQIILPAVFEEREENINSVLL